MSYISAQQQKNNVLVWERIDPSPEGRIIKQYTAPHYFYVSDPNGESTTIYNTKVKKYTYSSSKEAYEAKQKFQNEQATLWESDIGCDQRILSQYYYNKPSPKLNTTLYDIEVDVQKEMGFPNPKDTYAEINAISLYHEYLDELKLLVLLPPNTNWTEETLHTAVNDIVPLPKNFKKFVLFKTEKELLWEYLYEIQNSDIIAGWNSEKFDNPYVANRIKKILGPVAFNMLDFPEVSPGPVVEEREVKNKFQSEDDKAETFTETRTVFESKGRLFGDYLLIYKKYEVVEKASYKLSVISEEVLVDKDGNPSLPKLEYDGTIFDLYRGNFPLFCRYSIRDTEILGGFENKFGYIKVANDNYHLSSGQFKHVLGTIKLAEYAIIDYCHHELNRVVNNLIPPTVDKSIEGALVLLPRKGLHHNIGSIDIKSLYPSSIRLLNLSPEKIIGQFLEDEKAYVEINKQSEILLTLVFEDTTKLIKTAKEWRLILLQNNWSLSGYGTVCDQDEMGVIPSILTKWFNMRLEFQDLMKVNINNHELYDYNNRLQYVYKIKLNSLYGALINLYFRFYDLRLGESTTATGRNILRHQCRQVNELLEGNYNIDFPMYLTTKIALEKGYPIEVALDGPVFNGNFQTQSIIYGDTDSTYFDTGASSDSEAIIIADHVAKLVNDSFPNFVQTHFLVDDFHKNMITTSREIVSDSGIFVDKKRYILHLINIDGKTVNYLKIMGLDTKKTTLSKPIAKKLNSFIERLLKNETWAQISPDVVEFKNELRHTTDILSIGLPKGVNKLEQYTLDYKSNSKCRLPGHVSAAMFFNQCVVGFDDKVSQQITSGEKIKVFYLRSPIGRFKSIAIQTDTTYIPDWFLEEFKIDIDAHILRLVDRPLENILNAIGEKVPTNDSLLIESAWEF